MKIIIEVKAMTQKQSEALKKQVNDFFDILKEDNNLRKIKKLPK